jgi:hypothetical protein
MKVPLPSSNSISYSIDAFKIPSDLICNCSIDILYSSKVSNIILPISAGVVPPEGDYRYPSGSCIDSKATDVLTEDTDVRAGSTKPTDTKEVRAVSTETPEEPTDIVRTDMNKPLWLASGLNKFLKIR